MSDDDAVRAGDAIAVYGLLRPGAGAYERFGLDRAFAPLGPCVIAGRLYDLGGYPGLAAGPGRVRGEVFEIRDPSVMPALDAFEDYWPDAPERSRYDRRRITLVEPAREAWVYLWRLDTEGRAEVAGGDWLEWSRSAIRKV